MLHFEYFKTILKLFVHEFLSISGNTSFDLLSYFYDILITLHITHGLFGPKMWDQKR